MRDWIKCNLWSYLVFGTLPIIVGIAVGCGMPRYEIMTPLFIVPWVVLVQFFNLLIVFLLQRMLDLYMKKSKIIIYSMLLYMVKYLLFLIPLFIIIPVDVYVKEVFDIYMSVALYIYFAIINTVIEIIYNKFFLRKKNNNQQ